MIGRPPLFVAPHRHQFLALVSTLKQVLLPFAVLPEENAFVPASSAKRCRSRLPRIQRSKPSKRVAKINEGAFPRVPHWLQPNDWDFMHVSHVHAFINNLSFSEEAISRIQYNEQIEVMQVLPFLANIRSSLSHQGPSVAPNEGSGNLSRRAMDMLVISLFPSLSTRMWAPSDQAAAFLRTKPLELPDKRSKSLEKWEKALSARERVHYQLVQITRSDLYLCNIYRLKLNGKSYWDDAELQEWIVNENVRRQAFLMERHNKLHDVLFELYVEQHGIAAGKEMHDTFRCVHLFQLMFALLSRRKETKLQVRKAFVCNNTSNDVPVLNIAGMENTFRHQLRYLGKLVQSLGYDKEQAVKLIDSNFSDRDLVARTEDTLNNFARWQEWRDWTLADLLREQSSWNDPLFKRENYNDPSCFNQLLPFRKITTKIRPLNYSSGKFRKLRNEQFSKRLVRFAYNYLLGTLAPEECSFFSAREQADPLSYTSSKKPSSSFVRQLAHAFPLDSARFEYELWRYESSQIEREIRRSLENASRKHQMQATQRRRVRWWRFQQRDFQLWSNVVREELVTYIAYQENIQLIGDWWNKALGSRPVEAYDVFILLKVALPLLVVRDPLPRLASFVDFAPPVQSAQPSKSLDQTLTIVDSWNASLLYYLNPTPDHYLAIVIVSGRLDLARRLAEIIEKALHLRHQSGTTEARHWLELTDEPASTRLEDSEMKDRKEINKSRIHDVPKHNAEPQAFTSALAEMKVNPSSLPDQDGWLMIDLGPLMVLSCSEEHMLNVWLPRDKQDLCNVAEYVFIQKAKDIFLSTPLKDFHAVVKSTKQFTPVEVNKYEEQDPV